MRPTIETISGPKRTEEAAQLQKLYEAAGAKINSQGRFELPSPRNPMGAAILNEQAIAALRREAIYKRNQGNPPPPTLQEAFDLFQKAAALNLGLTAECFNYGCCCYYMNLYENGRMFFNLILDQAKREPKTAESERVIRYFAAFYNHIVVEHADCSAHARVWLDGKIVVNPDYFMSTSNPRATPPDRPVIDPDVLL
jgi:hypothetical protein